MIHCLRTTVCPTNNLPSCRDESMVYRIDHLAGSRSRPTRLPEDPRHSASLRWFITVTDTSHHTHRHAHTHARARTRSCFQLVLDYKSTVGSGSPVELGTRADCLSTICRLDLAELDGEVVELLGRQNSSVSELTMVDGTTVDRPPPGVSVRRVDRCERVV